jgi:hypothetical protein
MPTSAPTIWPTGAPSAFKSPAQILNLTKWYLQLPISATDGGLAMSVATALLQTYSSIYLHSTLTGNVVFYTPVEGAHTSGSKNCRTELRETDSAGKTYNWFPTFAQSDLSATLAVNAVPTVFVGVNKLTYIDIGQIKGSGASGSTTSPLAIMQYRYSPSTSTGMVLAQVYLDPAVGTATDYVLASNISINQTFSYRMSITQDGISGLPILSIGVNGVAATPVLSPLWTTNSVYFKAGVYLGDNSTFATGYGQATFYSLSATHTVV